MIDENNYDENNSNSVTDEENEIEEVENADNGENENINEDTSDNVHDSKKPQNENHLNIMDKHFMMENLDINFNSTFYSNRNLQVEEIKNILKKDSNHGLTGLKNLGNSCYINSAIQCLSQCLELTYYFLSNTYNNEVNRSKNFRYIKRIRPGVFSEAYKKIIEALWVNSDKFFSPTEFKTLIANLFARFNNNLAQDSHEMLVNMLDFIHEDLNQATIWPSNPRYLDECPPKMDNESDISAAKRSWYHYKERNNSIIVDLFTGQLKSTIECFACDTKVTNFQQFVTLPLAIPNMKKVEIIIVPWNNIKSTFKITFFISDAALFIDLPRYIKKFLDPEVKVDRFRFLLVNGRSQTAKFTKNSENIYTLSRKGFIFAYEVDERITEGDDLYPFITLVREETVAKKDAPVEIVVEEVKINKNTNCHSSSLVNFSYPRLFPMPNLSTVKDLRENIYGYMRRYCPPDAELSEKIFNNKYNEFTQNYKNTNSLDEIEFDSIIKEEYNFFFGSSSKTDEDTQKLKTSYLNSLPYKVLLISSKDESKSKLFFSGNIQDYNKTLQDSSPIEKLIDIIKTGCKLVIEVNKNEALKKEMNTIKSVVCKDKESEFSRTPTIYDCLDHFSLTERMDKGNEIYCNCCKKLQTAFKKLEIFYVPKNFIIVLNRFEVKNLSKFSIQILKNNTLVKYPVNGLNLTDVIRGTKDPKQIYDLYAVSQHSGSVEGGHYATACRNMGKWYESDDISIFPSEEELIVSPEGYILFFRKRLK